VGPRHWGVTTQKGSTVYVHALEPEDELIVLPDFGKQIVSAKLMRGGKPVKTERHDFGTVLHLPEAVQDPIDTIVALEVR
jgi:alpha-L-fucosidase